MSWVRSAWERTWRTILGGFITYLFESWLGAQHLTPVERAATYAVGAGVFSLALSTVARRFGTKGTDSFGTTVKYEQR